MKKFITIFAAVWLCFVSVTTLGNCGHGCPKVLVEAKVTKVNDKIIEVRYLTVLADTEHPYQHRDDNNTCVWKEGCFDLVQTDKFLSVNKHKLWSNPCRSSNTKFAVPSIFIPDSLDGCKEKKDSKDEVTYKFHKKNLQKFKLDQFKIDEKVIIEYYTNTGDVVIFSRLSDFHRVLQQAAKLNIFDSDQPISNNRILVTETKIERMPNDVLSFELFSLSNQITNKTDDILICAGSADSQSKIRCFRLHEILQHKQELGVCDVISKVGLPTEMITSNDCDIN